MLIIIRSSILFLLVIQENEKLRKLVMRNGPQHWAIIAKHFEGRVAKQCRARFVREKTVSWVLIYSGDIYPLMLQMVQPFEPRREQRSLDRSGRHNNISVAQTTRKSVVRNLQVVIWEVCAPSSPLPQIGGLLLIVGVWFLVGTRCRQVFGA